MSDERIDREVEPIRINRIKISNYRFFFGDFEINNISGNLLIYGENGSGKSSLYKAFELLASGDIDSIESDKNIFCDLEYDEAAIEFGFSNGMDLIINQELDDLPPEFAFVRGLSVFTPMLDYKKLLKVHYTPEKGSDTFLYDMLRQLLKDYPVVSGGTLSDIRDFTRYIQEMDNILNHILLDDINDMIEYFNSDFTISGFEVVTETDSSGRPVPKVKLAIDFYNEVIENYNTFLNEARLTALAISIYFASIKKMLGTFADDCLKILVLDDLLISLDMSKRNNLLELLKEEFGDFQIFFFTHDRELFELYKNKMDWEKYELYLDDSQEIPKHILKHGRTELERAKEFYAERDYEACGFMLRKGFEKLLKSYLTQEEQRDRNYEELDLAGKCGRAISKSEGEAKTILERLNSDRTHVLNPLCHYDSRNIHSNELRSAMNDLERLYDLLK